MLSEIRKVIADKGYVFLPKIMPGISTEEFADTLGETISPWDGGLVQTLVPTVGAAPNTYSGIYGLNRFPFHTDLAHWRSPPRYLLLRCVIGYSDVPTFLADGETLKRTISQDMMARAIFKQRRPLNGELSLLRLLEIDEEGREILRWDEEFLKPASKIGDTVNIQIREWLTSCQPISIGLERKHDTIIIDNWRMLHARAPIPAGRENRALERIYLRKLN